MSTVKLSLSLSPFLCMLLCILEGTLLKLHDCTDCLGLDSLPML